MPTLNTIGVFAAAVVVFAVVPGPAVFYIVTRSMSQGRRAGVVSAASIASGNSVHVVAATVGLSALLASSAAAFSVVKYAGAAYLIYLGVKALRVRRGAAAGPEVAPQSLWRVFREGWIVAVLNPKAALFFLAFLPQFVDPARGPAASQLVVLGLLLVVITATSDTCYALLTGSASSWLRSRAHLLRRGRLVTGGAYIALGVAAAVSGERPKTA
ncbi:MAG TPA: LysE family translocator [Jiangellales bacterium]|nr:LysE family translocator [Jiangellales bacterium]